MYFPYFRGKQYELITIRDNADLMSDRGFVPIVEPVKESLSSLTRTYESITDAGGRSILVINPTHGDLSIDPAPVEDFARTFDSNPRIALGIVLDEMKSVDEALALCDRHSSQPIALIHAGFTQGRDLKEALGTRVEGFSHIFVADKCSRLYRKHFQSSERVLIRDGFKQRKNRDYPLLEVFSDLHITYDEEGVGAFGDYLIVGDNFMEGGGPAYAVAIHLTFIDPSQDQQMYVYHFVSKRHSSPKDPAGKFAEALEKLVHEVEKPGSCILRTSAVIEYLQLHESGHFPGLGSVKKLSMNHHLETMADYFHTQPTV